jgi:alpha-L-arabinofuranosidase
MKKIPFVLAALLFQLTGQAQDSGNKITVDFAEKNAEISPAMYGVFFEEIGHGGEGGLYAEMLRNRSFEDNILIPTTTYKDGFMQAAHLLNYDSMRAAESGGYADFRIKFDTSALQGWELKLSGDALAVVHQTTTDPLFATAPHNLKISIGKGSSGNTVNLINSGFAGFDYNLHPYHYRVFNIPENSPPYGIAFDKNEEYNLRVIVRANDDYKGHIIARMLDAYGKIIGEQIFKIKNKNTWQEYKCRMRSDQTIPNGKFSLSFDAPGIVWVDFVSLMPVNTFNNRPNGLRKDVATMIANLKPGFIRWPGGCIVEGMTLANRYKWKETLGDPASRPGEFDLWGYRNSYGFGYHEFLQYCEDIGASGLFVCNVGMSCLYRNGDYCSRDSLSYYIQDALDAIEYAIGDPKTTWGAKRAAAGHPAPFPLKFIEVGNENQYEEYSERFDLFHKAIKSKYPQLTVISNYDMEDAENARGPGRPVEMIDPHWYESPDYFFSHQNLFDFELPRPAYKIYVGEYSANQNVGAGDMEGALSEAAFAMGMERNGDLVKMCSYAPLLQHAGDTTWPVNMIILKTDQVYGRSSYYVQQMLSENKPGINLGTALTEDLNNRPSNATREILRHYSIAGYDKNTNEIIIKVINAGPAPFKTKIDLKNAGPLAATGHAIVLYAESGQDENSFSSPKKISPKTETFTGFSEFFNYEFKPFSFTVLRIKRSS